MIKRSIYLLTVSMLFSNILWAADFDNCKVAVQGTIDGKIISGLIDFKEIIPPEGMDQSDYKAEAKVAPSLVVMLKETAESKYEIELYDSLNGVRVSSYRSLNYETGANGGGDEVVTVDAWCK